MLVNRPWLPLHPWISCTPTGSILECASLVKVFEAKVVIIPWRCGRSRRRCGRSLRSFQQSPGIGRCRGDRGRRDKREVGSGGKAGYGALSCCIFRSF